MVLKLIPDWRKSWKMASMWVAAAIMILSILDIALHQFFDQAVPRWIFYITGPGVAVARVVQQFLDSGEDDGDFH